jgi:general nucleoside transport system permease protein
MQPLRVALGAYLFAFLQVMGIQFQGIWPSVPAQVFQVAPFPLMIFTLVIIHFAQKVPDDKAQKAPFWLRRVMTLLRGSAPSALGRPFNPD